MCLMFGIISHQLLPEFPLDPGLSIPSPVPGHTRPSERPGSGLALGVVVFDRVLVMVLSLFFLPVMVSCSVAAGI